MKPKDCGSSPLRPLDNRMQRFEKLSREKVICLLTKHILSHPVMGVLLKHLTGFSEIVYGIKDDPKIIANIKKLLEGLRWKK